MTEDFPLSRFRSFAAPLLTRSFYLCRSESVIAAGQGFSPKTQKAEPQNLHWAQHCPDLCQTERRRKVLGKDKLARRINYNGNNTNQPYSNIHTHRPTQRTKRSGVRKKIISELLKFIPFNLNLIYLKVFFDNGISSLSRRNPSAACSLIWKMDQDTIWEGARSSSLLIIVQ